MNTVHLIDCMEHMAKVPDKYYNITLTDPPYNVGLNYNTHDDNMSDYYEWCGKWFSELERISETIIITVGYKNIKYWINKNYKGIIYWIKPNQNSPSQLGGYNCVEHIFYFGKLQNRIGQDYFIKSIGMQSDASFHPCPKYLPAWKHILKMVALPGAKVFDPFVGSGSSRIACYDLGFDFEGCELDADYYNAQEERYQRHILQGNLFDTAEIQELIYHD